MSTFRQLKNITSNLEVALLSNAAARRCTVLASFAMQNIKEIHCSISEIDEKTLKFNPLLINPWTIFFET